MSEDLDYCPACGQFAWRDLGHRCLADEGSRFWRGLVLALSVCAVIWVLAGLGAWRWLG